MGELLLLLGLVLFMWFFNVFLPDWLKRRQSAGPQESGLPVPLPVPGTRPPPPPPVVVPLVVSRATSLPVVRPSATPRQRTPRRLGSRQDLRRGIVLMTLLGPCRALEAPEDFPYEPGLREDISPVSLAARAPDEPEKPRQSP